TSTIRKIEIATQRVTTLAGVYPLSNPPASVDGVGSATRFASPRGIWGDGTYLYVGEELTSVIRRVSIATGETITIAGMAGKNGADDANGSAARFSDPEGVWGDGADLYVVDLFNFAIRRLSTPRTGAEPAIFSISPANAGSGTTATFTITGANFI